MYEYNQKMLYRVYACFCAVMLCFALYVGFSCRNSTGVQSSADREIGRIESQQRQIGVEIGRAGAEIESAENSIERAAGAISNSQGRAAAMQAGIKECEELTRQCQELAGRNAELIAELGKDN